MDDKLYNLVDSVHFFQYALKIKIVNLINFACIKYLFFYYLEGIFPIISALTFLVDLTNNLIRILLANWQILIYKTASEKFIITIFAFYDKHIAKYKNFTATTNGVHDLAILQKVDCKAVVRYADISFLITNVNY